MLRADRHLDRDNNSESFTSTKAQIIHSSVNRNNLVHYMHTSLQQGAGCEHAAPEELLGHCFIGLAGEAVAIIKAGLYVEVSLLHVTASAVGLKGAEILITQETKRKLLI